MVLNAAQGLLPSIWFSPFLRVYAERLFIHFNQITTIAQTKLSPLATVYEIDSAGAQDSINKAVFYKRVKTATLIWKFVLTHRKYKLNYPPVTPTTLISPWENRGIGPLLWAMMTQGRWIWLSIRAIISRGLSTKSPRTCRYALNNISVHKYHLNLNNEHNVTWIMRMKK